MYVNFSDLSGCALTSIGSKFIVPAGARQLSLPWVKPCVAHRTNESSVLASVNARWDVIDSSSMQQDGSGP